MFGWALKYACKISTLTSCGSGYFTSFSVSGFKSQWHIQLKVGIHGRATRAGEACHWLPVSAQAAGAGPWYHSLSVTVILLVPLAVSLSRSI